LRALLVCWLALAACGGAVQASDAGLCCPVTLPDDGPRSMPCGSSQWSCPGSDACQGCALGDRCGFLVGLYGYQSTVRACEEAP
jgi:hypothetical protein